MILGVLWYTVYMNSIRLKNTNPMPKQNKPDAPAWKAAPRAVDIVATSSICVFFRRIRLLASCLPRLGAFDVNRWRNASSVAECGWRIVWPTAQVAARGRCPNGYTLGHRMSHWRRELTTYDDAKSIAARWIRCGATTYVDTIAPLVRMSRENVPTWASLRCWHRLLWF